MAEQENPERFDFHKETNELNAMQAGKDDSSPVDKFQVAELAYVEIGADGAGSLSGYDRVALGGIPDKRHKTNAGRMSGNIQAGDPDDDSNIEDVKAGAQIRLRLTDYSHTQTIDESEWYDVEEVERSNVENRPLLKFDGLDNASWAKQGRHFVVEYRNTRSDGTQASYGDSDLSMPFIGARESVQ